MFLQDWRVYSTPELNPCSTQPWVLKPMLNCPPWVKHGFIKHEDWAKTPYGEKLG